MDRQVPIGFGIAMDSSGSIYVTDLIASIDFPTMAGALAPDRGAFSQQMVGHIQDMAAGYESGVFMASADYHTAIDRCQGNIAGIAGSVAALDQSCCRYPFRERSAVRSTTDR